MFKRKQGELHELSRHVTIKALRGTMHSAEIRSAGIVLIPILSPTGEISLSCFGSRLDFLLVML